MQNSNSRSRIAPIAVLAAWIVAVAAAGIFLVRL
jgi:hypothetical protein